MKLTIVLGVLILIFGLGACLEAGEIYQWVDKDGVLHFTDGPPPPGAEIVEGLSETKPDVAQPNSKPAERETAGTIEGDENPPPPPDDTGAVEDGENQSTSRDDYWRRRGWGNDTTGNENKGPNETGENQPVEKGDTGAAEGNGNAPPERKID